MARRDSECPDGWQSGQQRHKRSGISLKGRVEPGKDLSSGVNWPDM